jgi:hypothetical protein
MATSAYSLFKVIYLRSGLSIQLFLARLTSSSILSDELDVVQRQIWGWSLASVVLTIGAAGLLVIERRHNLKRMPATPSYFGPNPWDNDPIARVIKCLALSVVGTGILLFALLLTLSLLVRFLETR